MHVHTYAPYAHAKTHTYNIRVIGLDNIYNIMIITIFIVTKNDYKIDMLKCSQICIMIDVNYRDGGQLLLHTIIEISKNYNINNSQKDMQNRP